MPSVFFAFRDAPERRAALATPGALDRYRLFGLDEMVANGAAVRHNLERDRAPAWARAMGRLANTAVGIGGSLGGDFAAVVPFRRELNAVDVVFSTVDTVGLPILTLKRAGLVRPPVVYAAIGLPERVEGARSVDRLRQTLAEARTVVTYSVSEAKWLRAWIGDQSGDVVFIPFGVDTAAFRPASVPPDFDVVSVGADPQRDYDLLLSVAAQRSELTFRIVASGERARSLGVVPPNVTVEWDIPLEAVRDRLARARVVALPVRPNTYSGATTTLLQAMAMAKPTVVSRTDAIADGYRLEDGVNCRFVAPGDANALERALLETLTGADASISLGIRARETVERNFSWERYTSALWQVLFPVT